MPMHCGGAGGYAGFQVCRAQAGDACGCDGKQGCFGSGGRLQKKRGADVVATQVQDGRARSAQSLAQLFSRPVRFSPTRGCMGK